MPERLDRVTVSLNRGDVTFNWNARQALMRRLQHVQSTAKIRASFDAVGASRPVELSPGQRKALVGVLDEWSLDHQYEAMPTELNDLRDALRQDLGDLA